MRNFYLIFKKELKSYFASPIAYVVITMFLILTGYFFYNSFALFSTISFQATVNPMLAKQVGLLNLTESVVRPLFGNISVILLLMVPLLTMRLFSEEKKSGTIELLLTYPVTDMQVLLGKFLSCFADCIRPARDRPHINRLYRFILCRRIVCQPRDICIFPDGKSDNSRDSSLWPFAPFLDDKFFCLPCRPDIRRYIVVYIHYNPF